MTSITMQSESGGRRYGKDGSLLRSPVGAMGEMQVMPETARDPGYGIRPWRGGPDDLARVGRDYLTAMNKEYKGDPAKIWAAYNAGPGRTNAAIRKHGAQWLDYMPLETKNYVRKNMRALRGR